MGKEKRRNTRNYQHSIYGYGGAWQIYKNTIMSIRNIIDNTGINIGSRHITISTVGLIPPNKKLAQEKLQINLAISLHAPDNKTRSETMPINKGFQLKNLLMYATIMLKKLIEEFF